MTLPTPRQISMRQTAIDATAMIAAAREDMPRQEIEKLTLFFLGVMERGGVAENVVSLGVAK